MAITFGVSLAVGEDAQMLMQSLNRFAENQSSSVLMSRQRVLLELQNVVSDRVEEDWDGYGAKPFSVDSYILAIALIKRLPLFAANPDVDVDPEGEIMLEWSGGPRRVFTIAISPDGELHYAGLFGRNKVYGTEYFADLIPVPILEGLHRVCHRSVPRLWS